MALESSGNAPANMSEKWKILFINTTHRFLLGSASKVELRS